MNQKISIGNKGIFEDFQGKARFSNHADSFETVREWPEELGKGFIREIELRPGFKLMLEDFQLQEDFVANTEVEPSPLGFSFCVSGRCKGTVRGIKDDFIMGPKQSCLFFAPDSKGTLEHPLGERMHFVVIWVEPLLFQSFLGGEFDQIPTDLRGIIDGSNENHYNRVGSMTVPMQMAVHQILNCPYQGLTKRIYLESKAMELISHQLAQLVFAETGPKKPSKLRPDDIDRIREAWGVLSRNLQNPPSLFELARHVGVNKDKLNQDFHQIFGTSVFDYYYAYRLEQARQLLEERKMSITEVAFTVGYAQPGNFTRAFRQHFRISPQAYLRDSHLP